VYNALSFHIHSIIAAKFIRFNGLRFRSQMFHVRHSHSFTLISEKSFIYYFSIQGIDITSDAYKKLR